MLTLRDEWDANNPRKTAADWCDWFESVEETPQARRIRLSGLKPEDGAFERSVFRMEMSRGEWVLTAKMLEERDVREAKIRAANKIAKVGMPKTNKFRRGFGWDSATADRQVPALPSMWDL